VILQPVDILVAAILKSPKTPTFRDAFFTKLNRIASFSTFPAKKVCLHYFSKEAHQNNQSRSATGRLPTGHRGRQTQTRRVRHASGKYAVWLFIPQPPLKLSGSTACLTILKTPFFARFLGRRDGSKGTLNFQ
jgi:hypothetical protein